MNNSLVAVLAALCLNACTVSGGKEPDEGAEIDPLLSAQTLAYKTVDEAFLTPLTPADNIDSPASWTAPDGSVWLIATAKATDKLVVYDGDDGRTRAAIGGSGAKPGQFRRPNGIFVADDRVFVVERDNRRVQVLALPGLQPLGHFGEAQLRAPYGLWVDKTAQGYEVLVSDAYMDGEAVPPPAQLGHRFKRYRVRTDGGFHAAHLGDFGDTDAGGAVRIPESIWGDAKHGVLLLSEEDQQAGTQLKVYGRDYRYAGLTVGKGLLKAQAEGIALWQCPDGSGYWIATDQFKDRSLFHVFDRRTLAHLGAFAGAVTANTDGIWLEQRGNARFPQGVFYALHDDQAVAAFDMRDVGKALGLAACAP